MCGIAVMLKRDIYSSKVCIQNQVNSMLERISHRGPDDTGLFVDGDLVGLGMCRLAIVGSNQGEQPIWNENHSVVLVCNGEIYNYRTLRKQLELQGHTFSTESDVEVIIHLYEIFGEQCLSHLEGIFALALWDTATETLLVARDRLGVKPLYYAVTDGYVAFASELRALLGKRDITDELDDNSFAAYNVYRYVPAPYTIVNGIRKVAPGQALRFRRNHKIHKWTYWQPPTTIAPSASHGGGIKTTLKEHIRRAVESQVAPDVTSGVLLSGGLDSTILLASLTEVQGSVPDTYTVSFQSPREKIKATEYTEMDYAKRVAKHFGSHHVGEVYSAEEVLHALPRIVASVDEPIADPTSIPLWFASRLAGKSGVKVLYSGEGLDEIFNGYSVYRQSHWIRNLQWVPTFLRLLAVQTLSILRLPGAGIINRSLHPIWKWYQGVGGVFSTAELGAMINPERLPTRVHEDVMKHVRKAVFPVRGDSILRQMTFFDIKSWLPENTLIKSDKVAMSHSIELRVPFLDHELVEFALQRADEEKMRGNVGKWLVREAVRDFVPTFVMNRPKAGFPVPITAWIFGEWRDYVHEILTKQNSFIRDLYKPDSVERLFKSPNRGRAGRMLWTLLTFELWMEEVLHKTAFGQADKAHQTAITV